jgi:hypothetical protein
MDTTPRAHTLTRTYRHILARGNGGPSKNAEKKIIYRDQPQMPPAQIAPRNRASGAARAPRRMHATQHARPLPRTISEGRAGSVATHRAVDMSGTSEYAMENLRARTMIGSRHVMECVGARHARSDARQLSRAPHGEVQRVVVQASRAAHLAPCACTHEGRPRPRAAVTNKQPAHPPLRLSMSAGATAAPRSSHTARITAPVASATRKSCVVCLSFVMRGSPTAPETEGVRDEPRRGTPPPPRTLLQHNERHVDGLLHWPQFPDRRRRSRRRHGALSIKSCAAACPKS